MFRRCQKVQARQWCRHLRPNPRAAAPRADSRDASARRDLGVGSGPQALVDLHLREGSGSGSTVKPRISAGSQAENVPPDEFPNRDREAAGAPHVGTDAALPRRSRVRGSRVQCPVPSVPPGPHIRLPFGTEARRIERPGPQALARQWPTRLTRHGVSTGCPLAPACRTMEAHGSACGPRPPEPSNCGLTISLEDIR